MRPISIKKEVYFTRGLHTRKVMQDSPPPEPSPVPEGRIPRISRLMALAIRFDRLIKEGEITDQADLARLGNVSRARVTQIMNLLQLAPEIQEALLFLPRTAKGRDPIRETHIRPMRTRCSTPDTTPRRCRRPTCRRPARRACRR